MTDNNDPSLLYLGNSERVKVFMHSVCVCTAVLPGCKGYHDVLKYSTSRLTQNHHRVLCLQLKKFDLYQISCQAVWTQMHTQCNDDLYLFLFLSHSLSPPISLSVSVSVRQGWRLIVLQEMLSPYRLQACIL